MADPHGFGAGRGGVLEEERNSSGAGGVAGGGLPVEAAPSVVLTTSSVLTGVSEVELPSDFEDGNTKLMESERREEEETEKVSSLVISFGHDGHADFEESRVLHLEDGNLSRPFELSRAISTMVGSGSIDRHFVKWEQIDLVLASFPGARSTLTNIIAPKLKFREFRKIHIQETLNINPSSFSKPKHPKTKITSKAAQEFLTISNLPNKPRNSRPSRPSKPKPKRPSTSSPKTPIPKKTKPPPKTPIPKKPFLFPEPTPEWIAMMDRSKIQEPGQEGSSRSLLGSGKDTSSTSAKETRTMSDVLKGVQTRAVNGPVTLDASKVRQRGTTSQEDGIPCLHIPDSDNSELAGRMGLALIGKFSHSIPAPHFIRKALSNFKLKGTLSWNFINAKHILITLSEIDDYVKVLCGASNNNVWFVEHHPMRMFKWTPDFDLFFETPIAPVWCNLHALPIHLFEESMLFSIGKLFGEPIQIDHNTATRARLSHARICIEIDISKPPPEKYMLRIGGKDVTLQVKWEKIPQYCSACKHVGHSEEHCYAFGKKSAPPKKDFTRPTP